MLPQTGHVGGARPIVERRRADHRALAAVRSTATGRSIARASRVGARRLDGLRTVAHPRGRRAAASRMMHRPSRRAVPLRGPTAGVRRLDAYPVRVALYRLDDPGTLVRPALVVALDGWVDAGSAATTAAALIARGGRPSRRSTRIGCSTTAPGGPTLEIEDGRLAELTWPSFEIALVRHDERDLLILTGPEPDYRWRGWPTPSSRWRGRWASSEWISLGAIPAAVPHTRAVPILGTASRAGPPARRHPARPGRAAPRSGGPRQRPRDASGRGGDRRRSATSPRCRTTSAARMPPAALALLPAVARHLDLALDSGAARRGSRAAPDATRRRGRRRREHPRRTSSGWRRWSTRSACPPATT